jgi:carbonic anhydrase
MRTLKTVVLLVTLSIVTLPLFGADETCPAKWSYSGATGPDKWADIDPPVNAKCRSGLTQSPIRNNADQRTQANHPVPSFDYLSRKQAVILKNTSRELKVLPMFDGKLTYGNVTARLVQFHFHAPHVEHELDVWRGAVGELHMVHETSDGKIYVIAVPISLGTSNPALEVLRRFGQLKECSSRNTRTDEEYVPIANLLPGTRSRFITYVGSLTTPPCGEGVTFILMNDGITATQEQLDYIKIGAGNIRPPQGNSNPVTYRVAGQ